MHIVETTRECPSPSSRRYAHRAPAFEYNPKNLIKTTERASRTTVGSAGAAGGVGLPLMLFN